MTKNGIKPSNKNKDDVRSYLSRQVFDFVFLLCTAWSVLLNVVLVSDYAFTVSKSLINTIYTLYNPDSL